ncbi:MAG: SDR family oxidoreductase [Myxococcota bacterium]|jgi:NADP-dependent 3-hydroxy acid dehydrogenase YdfG|nr:SDR family oxidoreductase [Myxococcota bacterium]
MSNERALAGQTAVVTGSSSGIGRAIAEQLGAAGAHVFLSGRTPASMEESKKKIEASGGKASIVTVDVRDVAQVRGLVESAVGETGRLDIMVNNAGLEYPGSIMAGDPEDWREMFDTNVLAVLVGCQAAVKAMRDCGAEGKIVNISSVASQRGDSGVYGATKHAVNVISASLRNEVEEDTIRVTNVMPGAIATNFARNFDAGFKAGVLKMAGLDIEVGKGERLPEEVLQAVSSQVKERFGDPAHIADAVLYVVKQPIEVNIADITVRPPKALNLAH